MVTSYLIRVLLPDEPGALGRLASSVGLTDGNIQSVDVVEQFPDGTVMDDIVITLPQGALPDTLVTAIQEGEIAVVDSIRPFSGRVDRRGQVRMLATFAEHSQNQATALGELARVMPQTMTAGWCIILKKSPVLTRVAASSAAPSEDGTSPKGVKIGTCRMLDPQTEAWIPESWALLDASLAATPLTGTDLVMVIGRPGGPDFLGSEITHLGDLGVIIGAMIASHNF
ncbi:hypothetical protein HMPREF1219_00372 [Corynebacterium pyruviciproducens ATCC BAA-1742]|uniref:ACT domain-containing protein n=1 Tax=Corynebacterium pyruviciproducens ATCC BAA-1742 TaxID=1125779 RepID=S2Z8D4_9CORY|nr:hypothetical protein [Corynebacterium pyruviciproducens]EPD70560.1 hypothetical protein HMPREF1219_00372 [Corynebacterium pyruviciproducens ATCC BAA-1742]